MEDHDFHFSFANFIDSESQVEYSKYASPFLKTLTFTLGLAMSDVSDFCVRFTPIIDRLTSLDSHRALIEDLEGAIEEAASHNTMHPIFEMENSVSMRFRGRDFEDLARKRLYTLSPAEISREEARAIRDIFSITSQKLGIPVNHKFKIFDLDFDKRH